MQYEKKELCNCCVKNKNKIRKSCIFILRIVYISVSRLVLVPMSLIGTNINKKNQPHTK